MKKYDKIFIPVESDEDEYNFKFILYGYAGKLEVPVTEQSNVIVLSEGEWKYIKDNLLRLHSYLESGETVCFDNEYDLRDAKELHEFLKQKGLI